MNYDHIAKIYEAGYKQGYINGFSRKGYDPKATPQDIRRELRHLKTAHELMTTPWDRSPTTNTGHTPSRGSKGY